MKALLLAYALSALGLFLGFRKLGQLGGRTRQLVVWSFPVTLVGGILSAVIVGTFSLRDSGEIISNLVALMCYVACGFAAAFWLVSRDGNGDILKRGTRLVNAIKPRVQNSTGPRALTLAGQDIPIIDETKHFKMIGTTGTGKSTAIREILTTALARGDRAVIADPDGHYMAQFYNPARGDVVLNPFNPLAARWDLFAEIIQPHDADQLARSLIPDYEGSDKSWRQYGRTFLTALLRQLHLAQERDLAKLYWLLLLAPSTELRDLLEATPAGPFLGSDNGRFFESVRSVTAAHVAAIEHIARQTTGPEVSVRKWISEGKGVLFLPYRASEIAALRQVISSWMRLAIFQALDLADEARQLWFVVDELDALGAIDGLKDALARLRKAGGRCVLGFQSIAQVRGTYGDTEAQTIVENCGNTLILRSSASERGGTAEFASRLIGKREIIRTQYSLTQPSLFGPAHSSETISNHYATEDAVLASEIEQLPDLTGFLKIASRPEWIRVTLNRK